jgi:predicted amidophosphoribosyltransferase
MACRSCTKTFEKYGQYCKGCKKKSDTFIGSKTLLKWIENNTYVLMANDKLEVILPKDLVRFIKTIEENE